MFGKAIVLLIVVGLPLIASAAADGPKAPAAGEAGPAELPASKWEVVAGAPPGVGVLLERMKQQRQREFDSLVRAVAQAETDLAARKAGRVVKELKAPEGWRAVPGRSGGREYAFQTPQIKGREVVKAETALEHAKRRLAEIGHPEYWAKPVLGATELAEGAAGIATLRVVNQIDSTEAVVRVEDGAAPTSGRNAGERGAGKTLYLSGLRAGEYPAGSLLPDCAIEVVGVKSYQGANGRRGSAPHAKPIAWRDWVRVVRRAE